MKFFELHPWNVLSPYDLEDFRHSFNKYTISQRSKSASKSNKPKSPIVFRKSLPRRIDNCSHLLTPTKSSLQKVVKLPVKLQKSKSSVDLKPSPHRKQGQKKKENEILAEFYKNFESPLNSPKAPRIKPSNPIRLEIDTEQIEHEYFSPVHCPEKTLNLNTLNYYSTPFTVKEAICEDLLTGKIFSSSKIIHSVELEKVLSPLIRPKKQLSPGQLTEIEYPDEGQACDFWDYLIQKYADYVKKQQNSLIKALSKLEKQKKKVVKKVPNRSLRTLKEVSQKIGQLIDKKLQKHEDTLQNLLEQVDVIRPINLHYTPQYHQCQDFILDLLLLAWNFSIKPLTAQKISIFLETERLISDLPKHKDPSLRLAHLLNLIPLLVITTRYSEASEYIKKALSISPNSKIIVLWLAWIEILTTKNTSALYYSLSKSHPPANLSIQYKISLVYCFFYSCVVMGHSRTITYIKSIELGEWESLILADFHLRAGDKTSEESGIKLLKGLFEESPNEYVKFLSFFRLFRIYKSYNQHSRALEIVKLAEKANFSENLKVVVDLCRLKTCAKMNTELILYSDIPLLKYQYCRLSLKHNLRSPLNTVLKCINESCAYAQNYSLSSCQFAVNFWKFILYHKLKVHKLAIKQAQTTFDLSPGDRIKHLAINEALKNLNLLQSQIDSLNSSIQQKNKQVLYRTAESIEKIDPFLAVCIRTILSKSFQNKEKIPIHKFEGHFAIWSVLYSNSKHKEKQFKPLESQEEIDKRDKKHPLHILTVKPS